MHLWLRDLYFIVIADLDVSCFIYFINFKTYFLDVYFKYFNFSLAKVWG